MKKIIIFFILFSISYSKNISVKIDEDGINNFLSSVDSYKNKTQVDFKISKMNLTWKIYDGYLTLKPKDSIFTAKLEITTDNKVRNGTLEGEAKFSFDPKKQTLLVKIVDMKVRGLDIFNLVGFYNPKYELPANNIHKEYFEYGDIVIVNDSYKHYAGEVQIVLKRIKNDGLRNLVGHIDPQEMVLIELLDDGKILKFIK